VRGSLLAIACASALAALCAAAAAAETAAVLDEARKGVVTIRDSSGSARPAGPDAFFQEEAVGGDILGSGIVISQAGLVLTANHAVSKCKSISVVLWDSSEFDAKLVAAEPCLDVAILQIQNAGLAALPWRTKEPAVMGETVYAIGTPAILGDPVPSASRGIVSGVHKAVERRDEDGPAPFLLDLIETDAQLSPGQSGGALVDSEGRLVGMCIGVYQPVGAGRGRAFALPADDWLQAGLDSMVKTGRLPIGRLGLQALPLTIERARRLGREPRSGVQVISVQAHGPADKAGIAVGDVITRVDGRPVRLVNELRRLEMRLAPGSTAKVTLLRAGAVQPAEVEVAVASDGAALGQKVLEFAWRGMRLRDIENSRPRESSPRVKSGVVVVDVAGGSFAYEAGIRGGNIIVEVNNTAVDSLADFEAAVKDIPDTNVVRVRTNEGIGHVQGEIRRE